MSDYAIRYPRKVFVRSVVRGIARLVFSLFARVQVNGRENLPKDGPLIVVGNHVAVIEVALMGLTVPQWMEIIGVGDIPVDPRFGALMNLYGFIPIKRGSVDRDGLTMALDVLKQGGVVGMFPEGGIWETGIKQARAGVSWLSYKANAPILPMGFGGLVGAVGKMAGLKRPTFTVNIGEVIPPVRAQGAGRRDALEEAANQVMARIEALIPPDERQKAEPIYDERFEFSFVAAKDGVPVTPPPGIPHAESLGKFFFRPVLLDVMVRNLKFPCEPLQQFATERDPAKLRDAAQHVLNYLERDNPQFLNYRFGYEVGGAMQAGLAELRALAAWAAENGCTLELKPLRRYRRSPEGEEIVETDPGAAHAM